MPLKLLGNRKNNRNHGWSWLIRHQKEKMIIIRLASRPIHIKRYRQATKDWMDGRTDASLVSQTDGQRLKLTGWIVGKRIPFLKTKTQQGSKLCHSFSSDCDSFQTYFWPKEIGHHRRLRLRLPMTKDLCRWLRSFFLATSPRDAPLSTSLIDRLLTRLDSSNKTTAFCCLVKEDEISKEDVWGVTG